MAAKIEFTATLPNGEIATRTSGTMAYTHSVGGVTWHKSYQGAMAQQKANNYGPIVEVFATKVNGKVDAQTREFYAAAGADTNWTVEQVDAIVALIDAKLAGKKPSKVEVTPIETLVKRHMKSTGQIAADDTEWEYVAAEGLVAETVGTIANGVVTVEEIAPVTVETPAPKPFTTGIKLRITSRVSAHLVTVERDEVVAGIIAKMAAAKKRTDGSVTIVTTADERDMLVVHCTTMESDNLAGAGFHDLDRLNKVNAARWLVAKIGEAEAAAEVA